MMIDIRAASLRLVPGRQLHYVRLESFHVAHVDVPHDPPGEELPDRGTMYFLYPFLPFFSSSYRFNNVSMGTSRTVRGNHLPSLMSFLIFPMAASASFFLGPTASLCRILLA